LFGNLGRNLQGRRNLQYPGRLPVTAGSSNSGQNVNVNPRSKKKTSTSKKKTSISKKKTYRSKPPAEKYSFNDGLNIQSITNFLQTKDPFQNIASEDLNTLSTNIKSRKEYVQESVRKKGLSVIKCKKSISEDYIFTKYSENVEAYGEKKEMLEARKEAIAFTECYQSAFNQLLNTSKGNTKISNFFETFVKLRNSAKPQPFYPNGGRPENILENSNSEDILSEDIIIDVKILLLRNLFELKNIEKSDAGTDPVTALDAGTNPVTALDAGTNLGTALDAGTDPGAVSDTDSGTVSDAGTDPGFRCEHGSKHGFRYGHGTGHGFRYGHGQKTEKKR